MEPKFSTPSKLSDLEAVINTRTPVWDIAGSGDIHIKLDTAVNGQEWYVLFDDSQWNGCFEGEVSCWAFPHFNGAHDTYCYEPVAFCFKTFAELLASEYLKAPWKERAIWAYDEEEYATRLAHTASGNDDPFREEVEAEDSLPERMKSWGGQCRQITPDEMEVILSGGLPSWMADLGFKPVD